MKAKTKAPRGAGLQPKAAKLQLEELRRHARIAARLFTPDATNEALSVVGMCDSTIVEIERAEDAGDRAALRRALEQARKLLRTGAPLRSDAFARKFGALRRSIGALATVADELLALNVECPQPPLHEAARVMGALHVAMVRGRFDLVRKLAEVVGADEEIVDAMANVAGVVTPRGRSEELALLVQAFDAALATFAPSSDHRGDALQLRAAHVARAVARTFEQCPQLRRVSSANAVAPEDDLASVLRRKLAELGDEAPDEEQRAAAIRACLRALGVPESVARHAFEEPRHIRRALTKSAGLEPKSGTFGKGARRRAS